MQDTLSPQATECCEVVDAFIAQHRAWQADNEQPHPPASYWDAADAVLQRFKYETVPAELNALRDAICGDFDEQVETFHSRSDKERLLPGRLMWAAVEAVITAREKKVEPPKIPPVEPMQQLIKQGCSNAQIAKMYELWKTDSDGNIARDNMDMPIPDVAFVEKERKEPGSVDTPEFREQTDRRRYDSLFNRRPEPRHRAFDTGTILEFIQGGMSDQEIATETGAAIHQIAAIRKKAQRMANSM